MIILENFPHVFLRTLRKMSGIFRTDLTSLSLYGHHRAKDLEFYM